MKQKTKKILSVDETAELAFEELLELSTTELEPISKANQKTQIKNYLEVKENEVFDQKDLIAIINNVKQKNQETKGWVNPEEVAEENIINKARAAGKSEYDSDVLRELILKRQKERRGDKGGFGNLISSVRQKKDDYNK